MQPNGGADPFDLEGDDRGVLCVHGFTGTPFEMRFLGERLHRAGFTVRGVQLPGHGTSVDDLDRTTWYDWSSAVEAEIDDLVRRCRRVAVVGQSLGGLLALHAAARRDDLAAIATLAAPLWLGQLGTLAAHWTRSGGPLARVRRIPKLGGSDVRDREAKAANPCYRSIPTRALGSLCDFMRVVDAELPNVRAPTLIVHARHDHTAPVGSAVRIASRAGGRPLRTRILDESYHLVAIDVERDAVAAEVSTFFGRHAA
jgi:carboxylesterase